MHKSLCASYNCTGIILVLYKEINFSLSCCDVCHLSGYDTRHLHIFFLFSSNIILFMRCLFLLFLLEKKPYKLVSYLKRDQSTQHTLHNYMSLSLLLLKIIEVHILMSVAYSKIQTNLLKSNAS